MRSPVHPSAPVQLVAGTESPDVLEHDNVNVEDSAAGDDTVARELRDQRQHLRFDKMFAVRVESLLFGEVYCVARNVSAGGIFLEVRDPLPLGATVRVCFPVPDGSGDVVATGEVKNHYFINFNQGGVTKAVSGMAVRFTSFENEGNQILEDCLGRMRVLH